MMLPLLRLWLRLPYQHYRYRYRCCRCNRLRLPHYRFRLPLRLRLPLPSLPVTLPLLPLLPYRCRLPLSLLPLLPYRCRLPLSLLPLLPYRYRLPLPVTVTVTGYRYHGWRRCRPVMRLPSSFSFSRHPPPRSPSFSNGIFPSCFSTIRK